MTKSRLKRLRALIKEAAHLQCQYDDLICFPVEPVKDTVKDYKTGYPHTMSVEGYGRADYVALRQKIHNKHAAIQKEISYLEDWLDGISDSEIRDILRLQYINGLTQEQIAAELGYSRSAIAMKTKQFWD